MKVLTPNGKGRSKTKFGLLSATVLVLAIFFVAPNASATSQWARKYKTSCFTCHSAFPRLNYYGERFARNGYQDPDSDIPDGGKLGKRRINDNLSLETLQNSFGIRFNLTPFRSQTNRLTVDGKKQTKYTYGQTNWFQFFIAGTIAKNVSVFIEAEHEQDGFKFTWYHIGFHNIGGTSWLNTYIGNISPLSFAGYPNRLRQIGAIKGSIFGVKSSGGATTNKPEDALNISGFRPGINWFGYSGPLLIWAGISPGKSASDPNNKFHKWIGARLEIPESLESPLEGSNINVWYYHGQDAANTPTSQVTNGFDRYAIEGVLRYQDLDIQAAYVGISEDNYYLTSNPVSEDYHGLSILAGYRINRLYPVIQFDNISYDNQTLANTKNRDFTTLSLSYFLRDNIRIGYHYRIDTSDESHGYQRSQDGQLNIRIMF